MSVLKFFASSLRAARCRVLGKEPGEMPEALLQSNSTFVLRPDAVSGLGCQRSWSKIFLNMKIIAIINRIDSTKESAKSRILISFF